LLTDLASGGRVIQENAASVVAPPTTPRISVQWVLVLGVLLAISLLFNIFFVVR
jgi:hypothetical protein